MDDLRYKDNEILDSVKMIAPGTSLREGLESILRAKTGALIVIGENADVMSIVDGGFYINSDCTASHLYETAKMDGAIILSKDAKKILYANTQLIPDPAIPSSETGIRHRTAERAARQTGEMVISISERKNVITLYKGYYKYVLRDTSTVLFRANQAIQTLEKYRTVLDRVKADLTALEYEDMVTIIDVVKVIQRTEMVMRIAREIEKYVIELGNEGRLITMQVEELLANVEQDGINIIKDYCKTHSEEYFDNVKNTIIYLLSDELLDITQVSKTLGYEANMDFHEIYVSPRGYRLLNKIPRLPTTVIENLVKRFGNLNNIIYASVKELDDVEGIGEVRARIIKEGLTKIKEQVLFDRHI